MSHNVTGNRRKRAKHLPALDTDQTLLAKLTTNVGTIFGSVSALFGSPTNQDNGSTLVAEANDSSSDNEEPIWNKSPILEEPPNLCPSTPNLGGYQDLYQDTNEEMSLNRRESLIKRTSRKHIEIYNYREELSPMASTSGVSQKRWLDTIDKEQEDHPVLTNSRKRTWSEMRRSPDESFIQKVSSSLASFVPRTFTNWFHRSKKECSTESVPETSTESFNTVLTTGQPSRKRARFQPEELTTIGYNYSRDHPDLLSIRRIFSNESYNDIKESEEPRYIQDYPKYSHEHPRCSRDCTKYTQEYPNRIKCVTKEEKTSYLDDLERDQCTEDESDTAISAQPGPSHPNEDRFRRDHNLTESSAKSNYGKPSSTFRATQIGSPFYAGPTIYGGAASSSYINYSKLPFKSQSLNKTNVNQSVTFASSKIYNILEEYSSPVLDSSSSLFSDSINMSPSAVTKYKDLKVPNVAMLLKSKVRRHLQSTSEARKIAASQVSNNGYIPYAKKYSKRMNVEPDTHKLTTKIKSRLTRQRHDDNSRGEEYNSLSPIGFEAVPLQIDSHNLPKFTLVPTRTDTEDKEIQTDLPVIQENPKFAHILPKATLINQNPFEFSKPDLLISDSAESSFNNSNKFSFDDPVTLNDSTISILKTPEKPCKCGEHSFGSCNICKGTVIVEPKSATSPQKISVPKVDKWNCADCWVANDKSATNCICCGAKSTQTDVPSTPVQADWRCIDCWVMNKGSAKKCVACGGTIAEGKTESTKPEGNDLSHIIKMQQSMWSCSCCSVSNEMSSTVCVCCNTPKVATLSATKFAFDVPKSTYKFGIDKGEPTTGNVFKESEKSKAEESETNNNVLPKAPIMFNMPIPKSTDGSTEKVPTFTFGIPKATPPSTSTKIGSNLNEGVQEVPKVNIPETTEKTNSVDLSSTKSNEVPSFFAIEDPKVNDQTKNKFTSKLTLKPSTSLMPLSSPITLKSTATEGVVAENAKDVNTKASTDASDVIDGNKTEIGKTSVLPMFESKPSEPVTTLSNLPNQNLAGASTFTPTFNLGSNSDLGKKSAFSSTTAVTLTPTVPVTALSSASVFAPSLLSSTPAFSSSPAFSTASAIATPAFTPALTSSPNLTSSSILGSSTSLIPPQPLVPVLGTSPALSLAPSLPSSSEFLSQSDLIPQVPTTSILAPTTAPSAPLFAFGTNADSAALSNKPKFNFTFTGAKTDAPLPFENKASKFPLGSNDIFAQAQAKPAAFGGITNSSNMFGISNAPKPAAAPFAFGASNATFSSQKSPFALTNNQAPNANQGMFSANSTPSAPSMFAPQNTTPATGINTPHVFGSGAASTFGSGFGTPPSTATSMTLNFGTPNSPPTFGAPSTPLVSGFKAAQPNTGVTPFNFGANQQQQPMFGFGQTQQPPQQQPQQNTGVYNFTSSTPNPQMQFTMGSFTGTSPANPNNMNIPHNRRMRKAVRRNIQR